MISFRPFSSNFLSLPLLLHHGCLFSAPRRRHHYRHPSSTFKKKLIHQKNTITSFLKRLFSPASHPTPPPPSIPSPSSSTRSLHLEEHNCNQNNITSANEIHPCPICGEIFQNPTLLEHHRTVKHPISDLIDGENILKIIFKSGWPEKPNKPVIHRILKIHNTPKTLSQFEEYREFIKSKAASKNRAIRDERCIADGNELLRFHCTTFMCDLDSKICDRQYCCLCDIIRGGFSPKMDGISTFRTSWAAHVSVPAEVEEEFSFMGVKRALIVCRVISGRVGCDPGIGDGEDPVFDSLVGRGSGGFGEELLVFIPTAVLPCFIILYTA